MGLAVRHDPERLRYEILADEAVVGFLTYHGVEGNRCLNHLEVDDAYGGRGAASALVRFALLDAQEHGVSVLPACPFVRGFLAKHREFLALVPSEARGKYGLGADDQVTRRP